VPFVFHPICGGKHGRYGRMPSSRPGVSFSPRKEYVDAVQNPAMDFQEDAPSRSFNGRYDLQVKKDGHGGTGSFVTRNVDLKDVIFNADSDFRVKALSDVRLKDTCYYCLVGHTGTEAQDTEGTAVILLKVCAGCKTVRYCSPKCQKASWTDAHKDECKIFKNLHPRVLPSNVRAIFRLLLGKDVEGLHMKEILQMQDHLEDFEKTGGQRWQDLCLSAKAAKIYSSTNHDEATVLRLFGILQTNSFTMVTPTYDPLGVALHPNLGHLNHSCEYNATVRFGKHGNAEVIPVRPILAEEEILISYIDELLPHRERQAELKERYFFTCQCLRCERESSAPPASRSPASRAACEAAVHLLSATSSEPKEIKSALYALHETNRKITSYPMPSLRQQLITAYLSEGSYNVALVYAMMQSFRLDPVLYPATHHPIRMVHAWLCVRIIDQLLDAKAESVPQAEKFSLASFTIDLDFWQHAIVVSLHRSANIVAPGDFSKMVDARYNENKARWTGSEKAYQEQYTCKTFLESKWTHVQSAIDFVMMIETSN
jgi:hypothetical protein